MILSFRRVSITSTLSNAFARIICRSPPPTSSSTIFGKVWLLRSQKDISLKMSLSGPRIPKRLRLPSAPVARRKSTNSRPSNNTIKVKLNLLWLQPQLIRIMCQCIISDCVNRLKIAEHRKRNAIEKSLNRTFMCDLCGKVRLNKSTRL